MLFWKIYKTLLTFWVNGDGEYHTEKEKRTLSRI